MSALNIKHIPELPAYHYDRANKLPENFDSIQGVLLYHPNNYDKKAYVYIKADEPIFTYFDKETNTIKSASQTRHLISELETALPLYKNMPGICVTANRFNGRSRRGDDLVSSIMFFCDADIYKIASMAGLSHEEVISQILDRCEAKNIPYPNIVDYSGGGYYLRWLFLNECSKRKLSGAEYQRVETAINSIFADFGADNKAKDITRILRLPGTLNPKKDRSDRLCRTVFYNDVKYTMEELRDAFLSANPTDEVKKLPPLKVVKKKEIPIPKVKNDSIFKKRDPAKRPKVTKSNMQLAKDRYDDLKSLIQLRGGNVQHSRMLFLFWLLNFRALCGATNFVEFEADAIRIAVGLGFDRTEWSLDDLSTLERKVIRHNRGYSTIKKQDGDYFKFSNLYTPKNETLIDAFSITGEEQSQLKTIISPEEKQRRRAQKRRDAGMSSHEDSAARKEPWKVLGVGKTKYYEMKKNRDL